MKKENFFGNKWHKFLTIVLPHTWSQSNMGQVIVLAQKFEEYFNELEGFGLRAERFYDDVEHASPEQMKKWLYAAFIQGARTMAQDTVDTLRDYGTAVAGVEHIKYNATESFDNSADNLMVYYTKILDDAEKNMNQN